MAMTIDTVIFDLGGVLIDWNPRHLYRKLFDNEERMEHFLKEVCPLSWNAEMDRGKPFATAVAERQALYPAYAEEIAAYQHRWPEMLIGPVGGTVKILESLREQSIPLYALTNWSTETFGYAQEGYPFLKYFRDILISGVEKLVKPEPEIYQRILTRNQLQAENCVFIDDSPKNVTAAEVQGIKALHFQNPAKLKEELQALGFSL